MSKKLLWSVIALTALSIFSSASHADITRGCKAQLMISIPGDSFAHNVDTFEGTGSCKNKAQANKCRERAKNSIMNCSKDFWALRKTATLPTRCKPGRGGIGVKGLGPFKTSKQTRSRYDLKYAVEYVACCKIKPKANFLKFDIMTVSIGDKGCGNKKNAYYYGDKSNRVHQTHVMTRGYAANCKKLRAMGWCN